jgi:hypothetical protein
VFKNVKNHLSPKLDNQMDQFNRRLDSYMEYCDRKVSNNEGDIRELDNLVNQMPTIKHMETLLAENRLIRSNHQSPINDNTILHITIKSAVKLIHLVVYLWTHCGLSVPQNLTESCLCFPIAYTIIQV